MIQRVCGRLLQCLVVTLALFGAYFGVLTLSAPANAAPVIIPSPDGGASVPSTPTNTTTNAANTTTEATEEQKSTCTVDGVGWIVCPVTNFLAKITDYGYAWVSAMLTVPPLPVTTQGGPLYQAWSAIRTLANICFVIFFIVIIYSQLTSVGISNYGIKKLLPKLIISAILVNVSYWICALAIDLSNFLGYQIATFMATLSNSIPGVGVATNFNTANTWSSIVTPILAAAAAVQFLQLSIMFPLLLGCVLVILTVVVILTLRQGLIVSLVIISPLAFVAFLLPNTSKYFDRWWDTFKVLLMMFPIIAFVYAGSSLAGKILTEYGRSLGGNIGGTSSGQ